MSLEVMSPSSAFQSRIGGFQGADGAGASQSPEDTTQQMLKEIELLLMMMLSQMMNNGSGDADSPSSQGVGGPGGSGGGQDNSLQQMLADIARQWEQMNQGGGSGGGQQGLGLPSGGGGGGGATGADAGGGGGGSGAGGGVTPAVSNAVATPAPAPAPASGTDAAGSSNPTPASGSTTPAADSGNGTIEGLSTKQQTAAYTPEQSMQVAKQYESNLKKDFGLNDAQASAIVGNLWHESAGMNGAITQGGKIGDFTGAHPDDNQSGIGVAQWGGERATDLENKAKSLTQQTGQQVDEGSDAANYQELKAELQGSYSGAIDAVKKDGNDVSAATQDFMEQYEKPTDPEEQSRLQYAQNVFNAVTA